MEFGFYYLVNCVMLMSQRGKTINSWCRHYCGNAIVFGDCPENIISL